MIFFLFLEFEVIFGGSCSDNKVVMVIVLEVVKILILVVVVVLRNFYNGGYRGSIGNNLGSNDNIYYSCSSWSASFYGGSFKDSSNDLVLEM